MAANKAEQTPPQPRPTAKDAAPATGLRIPPRTPFELHKAALHRREDWRAHSLPARPDPEQQ